MTQLKTTLVDLADLELLDLKTLKVRHYVVFYLNCNGTSFNLELLYINKTYLKSSTKNQNKKSDK